MKGRVKALAQPKDDHKSAQKSSRFREQEKELEEERGRNYGLEEDLMSYRDQLEKCKEEKTKILHDYLELQKVVSNVERAKEISETQLSKELSLANEKIMKLESAMTAWNEEMKCSKEPRAESLGTKKRKTTDDGQFVVSGEIELSESNGETSSTAHIATKKTDRDKLESLDWKNLAGLTRVKTTDGRNKTSGSMKEDEKGGKMEEGEKGESVVLTREVSNLGALVPATKSGPLTKTRRPAKREREIESWREY
ncbi:hypothetical protein PRIPAC_89712 [Pristionchus pacificus]|uniref:Uncharacterized protein n=1 Tax=Pristionchus pacificus TaxID=54126 RepID=A0A2A6CYX9_PRIPA|nr:hypothetical protein PRIPAC_89712 [Pristionchus pacificus]|eukprot:PDM83375.1 hypothetical protein PRIPAC_35007 [Pristionchus pacificus]